MVTQPVVKIIYWYEHPGMNIAKTRDGNISGKIGKTCDGHVLDGFLSAKTCDMWRPSITAVIDGRHGWIVTCWISKSNKFSAAVQGDFPVHDDRNKFTCVVFKLFIALFVLWSFHRFLYRYHKLIMSQSSSVFRSILRACLHGRRVPRLAGLPTWKGWNIARLYMQLT